MPRLPYKTGVYRLFCTVTTKSYVGGAYKDLESTKGRKFSDEHRLKLSKALLGNKRWLGKRLSEETKRKISESNKGNQVWLGRKHSEETKRKMREAWNRRRDG